MRLKAKKIRRHDHDHIIEEIIRREALEPPDHEGMKKEHGKRLAERLLKADGAINSQAQKSVLCWMICWCICRVGNRLIQSSEIV